MIKGANNGQSTQLSIRLPRDVATEAERRATEAGTSRGAVIVSAVRRAWNLLADKQAKEPATTATTATTHRLYEAAVEAFGQYCTANDIPLPAAHAQIAAYLAEVRRYRGASVVPVHLSAIARYYRAAGWPLDTKADVIQAIVKPARQAARGKP